MCLGIVLQGAGHRKSVPTACKFVYLGIVETLQVRYANRFRHCFKRTYTRGNVNSCNDIHRTYSMLMLRHCQSAARHILIASYGRHRPRVPGL